MGCCCCCCQQEHVKSLLQRQHPTDASDKKTSLTSHQVLAVFGMIVAAAGIGLKGGDDIITHRL